MKKLLTAIAAAVFIVYSSICFRPILSISKTEETGVKRFLAPVKSATLTADK